MCETILGISELFELFIVHYKKCMCLGRNDYIKEGKT